jgi:hypothetical protein
MAIDESGKWWTGTAPDDVRGYLEAYAEDGYQVHDFRLARCPCGCVEFRLEADDNEGVARRTCTSCGEIRFIADSAEYWSDAEPEVWKCVECSSETTNVGVGFSLYEDNRGIRWLFVGVRCARCGILGCFAEWKVGTDDPSIMERA